MWYGYSDWWDWGLLVISEATKLNLWFVRIWREVFYSQVRKREDNCLPFLGFEIIQKVNNKSSAFKVFHSLFNLTFVTVWELATCTIIFIMHLCRFSRDGKLKNNVVLKFTSLNLNFIFKWFSTSTTYWNGQAMCSVVFVSFTN